MKTKILFIDETFGLIRNINKIFYKENNLLAYLLMPIFYLISLILDLIVFPLTFLHSIKIRNKNERDYKLEKLGIKTGWYIRYEN